MRFPDFNRARIRNRPLALAALLLALIVAALSVWWLFFYSSRSEGDWQDERGRPAVDGSSLVPTPPEPIYKSLTPEEALIENETIPFSSEPVEAALPLVLPGALSAAGQRTATECLTQAIYYEGATEPLAGRRGIAQVVLNRARHPAFPNSVCGVVYQGSERRTGCQFTFTCDGSLARMPSRRGWEAARLLAIGALNGAIEPSVGMATHYHADYVVPYWAASLDKIVKVGAHIFYRWKGGWGRRAIFREKVVPNVTGDAEMDELVTIEPQIDDLIDDEALGEIIEPLDAPILPRGPVPAIDRSVGNLTPSQPAVPSVSGRKQENRSPRIKADQTRGSLTIDERAGALKQD